MKVAIYKDTLANSRGADKDAEMSDILPTVEYSKDGDFHGSLVNFVHDIIVSDRKRSYPAGMPRFGQPHLETMRHFAKPFYCFGDYWLCSFPGGDNILRKKRFTI